MKKLDTTSARKERDNTSEFAQYLSEESLLALEKLMVLNGNVKRQAEREYPTFFPYQKPTRFAKTRSYARAHVAEYAWRLKSAWNVLRGKHDCTDCLY